MKTNITYRLQAWLQPFTNCLEEACNTQDAAEWQSTLFLLLLNYANLFTFNKDHINPASSYKNWHNAM